MPEQNPPSGHRRRVALPRRAKSAAAATLTVGLVLAGNNTAQADPSPTPTPTSASSVQFSVWDANTQTWVNAAPAPSSQSTPPVAMMTWDSSSQTWQREDSEPAPAPELTPQPEPTQTPAPATPAPETPTPSAPAPAPARPSSAADLTDLRLRVTADMIITSFENEDEFTSRHYGYIEYNVEHNDIDNRGYTAGIIGFCTKCGDLAELVDYYNTLQPTNPLSPFTKRLHELAEQESPSAEGLGDAFVAAWNQAAEDVMFRQAQDHLANTMYFNVAYKQATEDRLSVLGQLIYYDTIVMHGSGDDPTDFHGIRTNTLAKATPPSQGGDETAYLRAFLETRRAAMLTEPGHQNVSRIDALRTILDSENMTLKLPISYTANQTPRTITEANVAKEIEARRASLTASGVIRGTTSQRTSGLELELPTLIP